jgi:predicted nucleotide-binding protein
MPLSKERQELAELDITEKWTRIKDLFASHHLRKLLNSDLATPEKNEELLREYKGCLQVISNNIVMVYQEQYRNSVLTDEDISEIVEEISRTLSINWLCSEFDPYQVIREVSWNDTIGRIKKRAELELKVFARRAALSQQGVEMTIAKDAAKVFVVFGRNNKARKSLFDFLRSIKLDPQEWSEWVIQTGHPSPYIGDVLKTGFQHAQAFVVLMTPDDEARLREPLRNEHDESYEIDLTPQPRQNVIFEAGMAMAIDERRTILVSLGKVRLMSDIFGRHLVRLDDTPERRKDLAQRLETAGCPVKLDGNDWFTAGEFRKALEGL